MTEPRSARWLLAFALIAPIHLSLAAPPAASQGESAPQETSASVAAKAEPWIRLSENDKRVLSMEIASKEFRKVTGEGPTITLYGAVHIAEPKFYSTIQHELDTYDLVLFEGVNGGEPLDAEASAASTLRAVVALLASPEAEADTRPAKKKNDDKGSSPGLQAKMAKALGLTFQLDEMDHTRSNWRNSDMSVDEIKAAVEAKGGDASQLLDMLDGSSFMGYLANTLFTIIENIPGGSERARMMIMLMLPEADSMMGGGMPGGEALMQVIIEDRNQRVIDDLSHALKEASHKRIAVIYGAGHMGDMTDRMRDQLGYEPVRTDWHTAMSLDLNRAGISKSEHTMTRIAVKKQVIQMKKMSQRNAADGSESDADGAKRN